MPYANVLAAIKAASRPLTLEFEVRTDDFQPRPRALTACYGCVAVQTASGVILREVESGSPQSGNKSLVAGMHLISMKEGVSEATQLGDMSLPEVEALLAAWGRGKAAEPLTLNFQT